MNETANKHPPQQRGNGGNVAESKTTRKMKAHDSKRQNSAYLNNSKQDSCGDV